jgi:hypothetical protein
LPTGIAWTWDLDVGHAIEFACAVAGRDFTAQKWPRTSAAGRACGCGPPSDDDLLAIVTVSLSQ